MYKCCTCVTAGFIVGLDITLHILVSIQFIPLYHKCDIIALLKLVFSITERIFKVSFQSIIVKKCLDISNLTVAHNIKARTLFVIFQVFPLHPDRSCRRVLLNIRFPSYHNNQITSYLFFKVRKRMSAMTSIVFSHYMVHIFFCDRFSFKPQFRNGKIP